MLSLNEKLYTNTHKLYKLYKIIYCAQKNESITLHKIVSKQTKLFKNYNITKYYVCVLYTNFY